MLRVLTLSTLFPDATRPNFGIFVERQTRELAARPGIDLRVVAPVGLPPGPFSRIRHYRPLAALPADEAWNGLTVHRPRFTTLPGTGGRYHVAALRRALIPLLDRLYDDAAFDVIDAEFFFPDGPAAVALGKRYGVPVSIKARGADIHHWGHGVTAGQIRRAGQAADGLLAVSGAMKADMAAIGMPPDRIHVHHTGVDLDHFIPCPDRSLARAAWRVRGALIVSIGALIQRKGHDIVIDAAAALPDASLLIAGDGPERGALQARLDRQGLSGRVRLLGPVRHQDLPALLAAADVMALASASEGLANAWVEALACGTPVVVPAIGGAREVVTTRAAGRIVERTSGGFAAGIAALLAEPPPQEETRSAARHFTWPANADALEAHLKRLVAAGKRPPPRAIRRKNNRP